MKEVIIHMTKVKPGTTLASAKIATFMAKTLKLPLIDEVPYTSMIKEYWDIAYLINGPTAFCPFRPEIAAIGRRVQNMVWIQNDFTCAPPSQLNRVIRARKWSPPDSRNIRLPVIWGTIPGRYTQPLDRYVNWNALSYLGKHTATGNMPGVLYYGAFRGGRAGDFEKYLGARQYPINVSSSIKARGKFLALNKRIVMLPPFKDLVQEVRDFRLAIYMEDKHSHDHYTSPANRFYECLSAGIAQVFDEKAVSTFTGMEAVQVGQVYGIEKYVVTGPADVAKALKHWKIIAKEQARWHRDYRKILTDEMKKAHKDLLRSTR